MPARTTAVLERIVNDPLCPMCARLSSGALLAESKHSVAFLDAFPLNPGHALIVPRRHIADLYLLGPDEQADIWQLVAETRRILDAKFAPAGFNVGLNVGEAAGQTVPHAHVHVITRYTGDVPDPRGGVRWVIPARARYWKDTA